MSYAAVHSEVDRRHSRSYAGGYTKEDMPVPSAAVLIVVGRQAIKPIVVAALLELNCFKEENSYSALRTKMRIWRLISSKMVDNA